jgi:hypothetical protein
LTPVIEFLCLPDIEFAIKHFTMRRIGFPRKYRNCVATSSRASYHEPVFAGGNSQSLRSARRIRELCIAEVSWQASY